MDQLWRWGGWKSPGLSGDPTCTQSMGLMAEEGAGLGAGGSEARKVTWPRELTKQGTDCHGGWPGRQRSLVVEAFLGSVALW